MVTISKLLQMKTVSIDELNIFEGTMNNLDVLVIIHLISSTQHANNTAARPQLDYRLNDGPRLLCHVVALVKAIAPGD